MGLEFLTQPQVFTQRLTALGGIEGSIPPYVATFFTWTSTSSTPTSSFSLPGSGVLLDMPGAFIVSVGGVLQSPTNYAISVPTRTITFDFVVNPNTDIVVTQIGTVGLTANIDAISSVQVITNTITATNIGADNLIVTNLTALSSVLHVTNIQNIELSGFTINGLLNITDGGVQTTLLTAGSATMERLSSSFIASEYLSSTNVFLTNSISAEPITETNVTLGQRSEQAGLTGFKIRLPRNTNLFVIDTIVNNLSGNKSVIIDAATGYVGISSTPNQALTVGGNISATEDVIAAGFVKARNLWPNRQYTILTADSNTFAAATVLRVFSATPIVIQPNVLYSTGWTVWLSGNASTNATPIFSLGLSGSTPFSILEGWASGPTQHGDGSGAATPNGIIVSRDLRELNIGSSSTYTVFPSRTYSGGGPHGWSFNAILSSTSTTTVVLCSIANIPSNIKGASVASASILQEA